MPAVSVGERLKAGRPRPGWGGEGGWAPRGQAPGAFSVLGEGCGAAGCRGRGVRVGVVPGSCSRSGWGKERGRCRGGSRGARR